MLIDVPYYRQRAIEYAYEWVFERNPAFYDFTGVGGDCTSYVSQCIYAGGGVMNYEKYYGWYYISPDDRAPAWSGVQYLYDFLINNAGVGPHAVETGFEGAELADVVQLANDEGRFYHTMIISKILQPTPEGILICSHTNDSKDRPLSTYDYANLRILHISQILDWANPENV